MCRFRLDFIQSYLDKSLNIVKDIYASSTRKELRLGGINLKFINIKEYSFVVLPINKLCFDCELNSR